MKFGIIKERKNPPDRRVVLSPQLCQTVLESYPKANILVEPSDIRVFGDKEYQNHGVTVSEAMEDCEVLLGVKEVPVEALIPNKSYFFFSHTIKKQPYNTNGQRLVAFGRYAGIVGAYNGIRAFGLKYGTFDLPKAEHLRDQPELIRALQKVV